MSGVVVIGAGQAAASFAAKFRSIDTQTPLTIIGDEPLIPYQRPPLSKKYATGEMAAAQLFLRPQDWYDDMNIKLMTGAEATAINRAAQTVTLGDGTHMPYDQLMLATGSAVRRLPQVVTNDLKGIHYLRSLADADHFGAALDADRHALIVGGGYIGLEAAAVCRAKGMRVTLVEAAERILQRVACSETSDWFRALHQSEGVEIIEGVGLTGFEGKGTVSHAVLTNGQRIDIDLAIVGIGIIPNAKLAKDAGLTVDNGIVVNEACRTSDPRIFAAGDCAVFEYDGAPTRLESVPNAIDQATAAAQNAATPQEIAYVPKPWFWSDQYDVKLQIAGLNRGYDTVITREGDAPRSVSHFYYQGEQLKAIDAMNQPRIYMIGKRVLEAGKNIPATAAADPSADLKAFM